jgi:hypothetical protein
MSIIWGVIEGTLVIGSVVVLWAIVFLLIAWFIGGIKNG